MISNYNAKERQCQTEDRGKERTKEKEKKRQMGEATEEQRWKGGKQKRCMVERNGKPGNLLSPNFPLRTKRSSSLEHSKHFCINAG